MKKTNLLSGMMFLILAQTMVGLNIVISKLLVSSIPILVLLVIRFSLATLILLTLHWITPANKISIKSHISTLKARDWGFIVAQALTAGVLFNVLMLAGLNYTDANVAGIITSALPAIIVIMAWILLSEKISAQKSICILLATAGLMIIAFDKLNSVGEAHSFLGDFIVLLSLLPEAAYYILCKLYSNRLPIFLTSALLNGINAVILIPAVLFMPWELLHIHVLDWIILFVVGLSSGLFYVFWFMGAQRVDAVLASLTTAIMPVATVIMAWIILSEQLSSLQLAGMSLVILSVFVYARR